MFLKVQCLIVMAAFACLVSPACVTAQSNPNSKNCVAASTERAAQTLAYVVQ
jgi:hypothetical protein